MILPIECKDKILDGSMQAFIRKKVEVGLDVYFSNKFYFVEKDSGISIITNNNLTTFDKNIAKAECVGVVECKLYKNDFPFDRLQMQTSSIFDLKPFGRKLLLELGFSFDENKERQIVDNVENYYQALLGETMEGYLHMFKLIKEGK